MTTADKSAPRKPPTLNPGDQKLTREQNQGRNHEPYYSSQHWPDLLYCRLQIYGPPEKRIYAVKKKSSQLVLALIGQKSKLDMCRAQGEEFI